MNEIEERQDPYTLVFGAESMDERLFPPIVEEAEARGAPLDDPERFLHLSSVGRLLQAIAGSEPYADEPPASPDEATPAAEEPEEGTPSPGGGAGEALRQYGRLLFHAVQFWRVGSPRYGLHPDRLRYLLDEVTTVGDWTLRPPARAGYLRLPRNLVWAAPAPNLRPEPADGFFWSHVDEDDGPGRLHLLLALGVRPDRAGFSVLTTTGVRDTVDHWAESDARPGGPDFESTIPGGELDRLYSIESAAELLKLASLCFWELDPARG